MQSELNPGKTAPDPLEFETAAAEYFKKSLTDKSYFSAVAELDQKLISANGLVIYRKPPAFVGQSGLVGYVTNVYTIPDFRGRGVAKQLMDILVQFARSAQISKLHLGTTDSGKKLYEAVGFVPVKFEALELRL